MLSGTPYSAASDQLPGSGGIWVHGHCQPLLRGRGAERPKQFGHQDLLRRAEGSSRAQSTPLPMDLVPAALQNSTGTAQALVPGACRALASLSSTRDVKSSHEKTSLLVLIRRQRSARRALKNTNCINRCSSFFFLDDKKRR